MIGGTYSYNTLMICCAGTYLEWSYDCSCASEVIVKDMGKIDGYPTMAKHRSRSVNIWDSIH